MIRKRIVVVAALVTALVAAQSAHAQTTLRYKFKDGEKLNYIMDQKMSMKMSVMGQDIDMSVNQTIDISWNVKEVKDGKAKMTQKFERFRFNMDGGPTGKIAFDSKDPKEPEGPIGQIMGPMLKALAGMEVSMTMDEQGEISEVKVPPDLVNLMKKAGGAPGMDMFSEDGIKKMLAQGGMVLPKDAVTKGKTWAQKVDQKTPIGTMKLNNEYTYEGSTEKDGRRLEQVAMKPAMAIEADPNAPITIKMKESVGKGSAYFDNASGRLVEMSMTQNMEMDIAAGGQNISQRMNQVVTLKLQEK